MNEISIPVSDFLDFAGRIYDVLAKNCIPDAVFAGLYVVIAPDADGVTLSVSGPMMGRKKAGGKRVQ